MDQDELPTATQPTEPPPSKWLESIMLDFGTIRIIVLTAAVVLVLLSIPLIFILRNLISFDDLDSYLKMTESLRPKILTSISEEIDSGYSKNFLIDSHQSDSTLLFYSHPNEKVILSLEVEPFREGTVQPINIQVNGSCLLPSQGVGYTQLAGLDISKSIEKCPPIGGLPVNTLRIVFPDGLKKGNTLQIRCLVLVSQRVHEHLEKKK